MVQKLKIFWIILCLLMISQFGFASQVDNKMTIAVLDFKNNTSRIRYDRLQRTIAELLKTELSRCPDIAVVERTKLESILTEYALAQAGYIEKKYAQEVGRLAGAEYIITGEINQAAGRLRIDSHLIKVQTGRILGEKVTGSDVEKIEAMINLLAQNLIFDLTGRGEKIEYKKLHNYHSQWAFISTGGLALSTIIYHSMYKKNYDKYHEVTQLDKFDYYYDKANKNYKIRNVLIGITSAAAITSFILWRAEKSNANKIFAESSQLMPNKFYKQLALGFWIDDSAWTFSLNLSF